MQTMLEYPRIFNNLPNYGEIMEERLLNTSEVAEWLNMDEVTVQKMSRDGRLPAVKIGRGYRFRKADLEEWFNQQKDGTGQSQ